MLAWGERRLRALVGDDWGFSMVEVVVAAMVMAIAVTGVIGSMGAGMGLVGHSRQRSAGSSVATERVENIRNIPYEFVELNVLPTHSTESGHPDEHVTTGGLYEVKDVNETALCGEGDLCEPIIYDEDTDGTGPDNAGNVLHEEDPCGPPKCPIEFKVHQYVTWVDDTTLSGTQNYKRVIVVVTWKFPVTTGRITTITQSTFVSKGTVEASAEPAPSPSTGPAPTLPPLDPGELGVGQDIGYTAPPQPNPAAPCPTDVSGPNQPEAIVVSGAGTEQGFLASTSIQVRIRAQDPCRPVSAQFSNDGIETGYQTVSADVSDPDVPGVPETTVQWTISDGEGPKYFWVRFKDDQGNFSTTLRVQVVLDTTKPAIPGSFAKATCSMEGSDRTIGFTWTGSLIDDDTNGSGWRLYKKIENGPWTIATNVATTSASDTDKKSYNSLQYKVRMYDKAGNESADSAIVSFAKNQC